MRLLPYGADGLLAEFDSIQQVRAAHRAVLDADLAVEELIPAARTLLLTGTDERAARDALEHADEHHAGLEGKRVRIRVRYDGPDLPLVAEAAGLTPAETVESHTAAEYTVAFCGFAPGFGYLTGLPEPLQQPRLPQPRTTVPAGSVGVAGEFSAVYPRASPGGWRLIGTTDRVLFDPKAEQPALLRPGDTVRFEPC